MQVLRVENVEEPQMSVDGNLTQRYVLIRDQLREGLRIVRGG